MDAECRRLHPLLLIVSRVRTACAALGMGLVLLGGSRSASAQIRVNPVGVNVNVQGATSVFLTFGGVAGHEALDATWCGTLVPAAPDVGLRCAPGTIFGQLPARFDLSRASGTGGFTDIMTIPPSVARRAYQAAERGDNSAFFYVRRFRSLSGGPDQFVAVTCRLTGGGARTPLALTDVQIMFAPDLPVLQVTADEPMPPIAARIAYNGTGRLVGRWEVVMPGEATPTADDLLTEASLPVEQRGEQRRYTQIARFNVFLPPTGRVTLPGPDPRRFPRTTDGVYQVLLRIEASPDKEGDSNLGAVGAGDGIVIGGAVAGFPMPTLRYVVGSGVTPELTSAEALGPLAPLQPAPRARVDRETPLQFSWRAVDSARVYRLQVEAVDGGEERAVGAIIADRTTRYAAPTWFRQQLGTGAMRWRVSALDNAGRVLGRSAWWTFEMP